jgi:hypothetical protein
LFTRSGPDDGTVADLPSLAKRQVSGVVAWLQPMRFGKLQLRRRPREGAKFHDLGENRQPFEVPAVWPPGIKFRNDEFR